MWRAINNGSTRITVLKCLLHTHIVLSAYSIWSHSNGSVSVAHFPSEPGGCAACGPGPAPRDRSEPAVFHTGHQQPHPSVQQCSLIIQYYCSSAQHSTTADSNRTNYSPTWGPILCHYEWTFQPVVFVFVFDLGSFWGKAVWSDNIANDHLYNTYGMIQLCSTTIFQQRTLAQHNNISTKDINTQDQLWERECSNITATCFAGT